MKILKRAPKGRVAAFIDGFNVFHSLLDDARPELRKYWWLNYRALCERLLPKREGLVLKDVHYCTAYASHVPSRQANHQVYVKALESANVLPVFGKFKERSRWCPRCKRRYRKHEEKMTDVNIAVCCFEAAIKEQFDTAMIVSADGDLRPLFEKMETCFPNKRIGVVFPLRRWSNELRPVADFLGRVREADLVASQFPDEVSLGAGKKVTRPPSWNWPRRDELPDGGG